MCMTCPVRCSHCLPPPHTHTHSRTHAHTHTQIQSVQFLYFKGRVELMRGQVDEVSKKKAVKHVYSGHSVKWLMDMSAHVLLNAAHTLDIVL